MLAQNITERHSLFFFFFIPEEQSISIQSTENDREKKAITNFLHGSLQRGTKGPQDTIISVGFKREKEDDPYNVNNLFSLFLKNKINWKIVCLN